MKIKKVGDMPMVIHTKQKTKIHSHEPKNAAIKGSNIYNLAVIEIALQNIGIRRERKPIEKVRYMGWIMSESVELESFARI